MDANKDEAAKCFKMAKLAMSRQDYQKAMKLGAKANNMFPCQEYKAFVDKCLVKLSQENTTPSTENPGTSGPGPRNRRESVNSDSTSRSATDEQETLCRKIVNSKNYYEMLQVSKTDSVDKIKKNYKKLALKLHPDKNPSPLASEAFKKVSTAFQCLTNPKAREAYDLYGDEDRVMHQTYQQEFVTPEQLFEAFFGINTRGNVYHYTTAHTNRNVRQGSITVAQLAPLLVLLGFLVISNMFSFTSKVYEFQKTGKFTRMMSTSANGVVYFVDPVTFEYNYPAKSVQRIKLDYEIDFKFFQNKCEADKGENQKKINSYLSSRKKPPKDLYSTPKSCVTLQGLRKVYTDQIRANSTQFYF